MQALEVSGPAGLLRGWTAGERRSGATPVLFIHPINLQGKCWAQMAGALPDRLILMPDLRGHGGSDARGPFGLDDWSADLLAVLDAYGLDRVHVVGGSLGGPLAVHLAATHPDRVVSITAIGSALHITGDDVDAVLEVLREKGVKGMFREVIPQISVAAGTDPAIVEEIIEMANPNDVETVGAIWGATITSDATSQAAAVRCPALVITGEEDRTCTPEQGREMAGRLGVELVLLPDVGHLPMLEAPEKLVPLIANHLIAAET